MDNAGVIATRQTGKSIELYYAKRNLHFAIIIGFLYLYESLQSFTLYLNLWSLTLHH